MISADEALRIVLVQCWLAGVETVHIDAAQGRTLGADISADRDFPPFNRVTMDGIAIAFSSFEHNLRTFSIDGIAAAGSPQTTLNSPAGCMEVMTGAMLPVNCDTVIRYEDLTIESEKATINIDAIKVKQNVHFQGSDLSEGSILLQAGKRIGAAELGVLATCGYANVMVYKTPRIAIVSSGDELVNIGDNPLPHQIRRSNNYSIESALAQFNCETRNYHLNDDPQEIKSVLGTIISDFDVVILSGGVSMGKFDYIPDALEALGVRRLFHKVLQRPGKPFWFGKTDDNQVVFALPGNPVSSFMCTNRYVLAWMRKHLRISAPVQYAELTMDVDFKPDLTYFAQVKLSYAVDGKVLATPIVGNGSGDLSSLTHADAFMELPRGSTTYPKGKTYPITRF